MRVRWDRWRYFSWILLLLIFARSFAEGQAVTSPASANVTPNAAAIAALTASLNAMGGSAAWSNITSSTVTGTSTFNGESANSIKWEIDWSTGALQWRRELNGPSGNSVQAVSNKQVFQLEIGTTVQPPPPHATLVSPYAAFQMPGKLFSTVASMHRYVSLISNGNSEFPGDLCIEVEGADMLPDPRLGRQEWYLNSQTKLPDAVEIYMSPSQLPSKPILKLKFLHYASVSGVMVPDHFQQITGQDMSDVQLEAPTFNAAIPTTQFSLE